ncbi:ABC transporter substrate-binding protein [Nocardioides sp. LMS-CY]|uniref:ABC transporter substrate-binding protein n=1 Tax=Nocardioides sp. (strain LMS-CY) TaxID=2840457 RepID=UPI001C00458B|nr:ABC transporter substrate-binding protein [Nocardioides sp. LMS-CY]QWF21760.1 ABC transporter substrate-binding protein [Nocardioides sp. LMS-CY]
MVGILFKRSGSQATRARRVALVAAAVLVAAAALSSCGDRETAKSASEGSSMEVQMAWLPNVQGAGEYVAEAKGFYEDAGLEVHLTPGGPNANPVQLVAAGKAEVGVTYAPTLMLARNEDIPVKAFGAAMQKAPLAYFSLESEKIRSVADLKGKTIGIQVGGEALLESMLQNNGMQLSDVKTVTIGADFTPLTQGQVDVLSAWEINLEQIAPAESFGLSKLMLFENGTRFQSNYYVATDDTLSGDTADLTAFVQASAKGWAYAFEHPEETVDILMDINPALNRDLQLEQLTEYLPDYVMSGEATTHGFGWMDEAMWKSTVADFQSFGIIKDDLAPQDMYTMDVLEAADLGAESSK